MDYKECPSCRALTSLDAMVCAGCGHQFRTQFQAPPANQTRAFSAPSPPNWNYGPGYAPYPHYYRQPGGFGLPGWACFVIAFLIPIAGIVLAVLCYSLDSIRDPEKGKLFIFGVIANFVFWCGGWLLLVGLGALVH